jgi:hypothetical protein
MRRGSGSGDDRARFSQHDGVLVPAGVRPRSAFRFSGAEVGLIKVAPRASLSTPVARRSEPLTVGRPLFLRFIQRLPARAVARPRARGHGQASNKPQDQRSSEILLAVACSLHNRANGAWGALPHNALASFAAITQGIVARFGCPVSELVLLPRASRPMFQLSSSRAASSLSAPILDRIRREFMRQSCGSSSATARSNSFSRSGRRRQSPSMMRFA